MLTVRSTINISSQTVPPIIPVVQGDTGRAILFTLADFTIPAGAAATYYVQKPSGEAVYNNATIDGNNILVELTAQSIIEKGDNYGQVRIAVGGDVVTSFDFILLVKEFRGIEAVQSLTEMNIFDKAVEQAADAIDEVKTDALDDIGDAKDAALQEIEQTTGNFADDFSASATYAAGDYVMHSGQLYRFTANHAAGAWIGSDAEAVTVGEELTDLKAETSDLKEELYYTVDEKDFTSDLIEGSYIKTAVDVGNTVDMTPIANNSFAHIVIPCSVGANFVITGSSGSAPRLWAFVDKDNKMLAFASSSITGNNLEVTAPTNTAKAIFNVALYAPRSIVQKNVLIPVKEYLAPIAESASQNDEALSQVTLTSRQLFNRYEITENKAYSSDGQSIVDDSTRCLSDFIPVEGGTRYTILACVGKLLFFSADKSYITAYSASSYETAQNTTAPATAYYLRLEMNKYFYPYAQTMVVKGTSLGKDIRYGALINEDKIESKREYEFSDIQIPKEYSAIGVKAVDGTQDFDDYNPSVSQLYDAYDALMADFPDYITKEDFGMDASDTYHMYAYYFTPENVPTEYDMYRKPYPKVNLRSGIHGNGTLGDSNINLFCLYYLMKSICYNWRESEALEYLRWNVRFAILPLQNPWGFENKKRFNSNGVDINRNFSVGWQLGTSGNPDYGGASPLSESETNNIIAFEQANADAIFSVDVHSQAEAPQQSQMSYMSLFVTSDMFDTAKSLVTKISHVWDSQNIPNLQKMNFHGYVACEFNGWGTGTSYITAMIGTPALTLEGFKNFANSSYTNGSVEVVKMVADQLGYGVLLGLSHFK